MKRLYCAWFLLGWPLVGLAQESPSAPPLLQTPMPWSWRPPAVESNLAVAPPTTNAPAVPPGERFLQFATKRRFPRIAFQANDRLRATTLGLRVEPRGEQMVVTTPVGLGLTETEARALISPLSASALANYDVFEWVYRASLVPEELGGPGLTFAAAQARAWDTLVAARPWPGAADGVVADGQTNHPSIFTLRRESRYVPWTGAGPWLLNWGFYEYPSTASPPASFSEQMPRPKWESLTPALPRFSPPTTPLR
jgi:hypothetical protein